MVKNIMDTKGKALIAFRIAVKQYKPWHRMHWNSKSSNAFPQLISGGLKHNFFDLQKGAELFNTTEENVQSWADGQTPSRKERKQVWRELKKLCGVANTP